VAIAAAQSSSDEPDRLPMYADPASGTSPQDAGFALYATEMLGRLSDPVRRSELRAERYADIVRQHPDLQSVLRLDDATAARLLELLTDLQMESLDRAYSSGQAGAPVGARATQENRLRDEARIADMFGATLRDQYRQYQASLRERQQVAELNNELGERAALTFEQKERLVSLLAEERTRAGVRASTPDGDVIRVRAAQKGVAMSPADLREMELSLERVLTRAAEFLTSEQLETFERNEMQKLDAQRRWMRAANK
jgi:hypothetical protein